MCCSFSSWNTLTFNYVKCEQIGWVRKHIIDRQKIILWRFHFHMSPRGFSTPKPVPISSRHNDVSLPMSCLHFFLHQMTFSISIFHWWCHNKLLLYSPDHPCLAPFSPQGPCATGQTPCLLYHISHLLLPPSPHYDACTGHSVVFWFGAL